MALLGEKVVVVVVPTETIAVSVLSSSAAPWHTWEHKCATVTTYHGQRGSVERPLFVQVPFLPLTTLTPTLLSLISAVAVCNRLLHLCAGDV
jgi:hypothetical protein